MPREYRSGRRAEEVARTRRRILDTALRLLPEAADLPVDAIAAEADVSVQTLYTHFGSKRGLFLAMLDTVQSDAGIYEAFEGVWQSRDGETALRRMVDATVRLWDRAWPTVAFTERARRTDPEILRYLREIDGYRLANLVSITERLALEARLRPGLDARAAAQAAFALSMPSVYEELVTVRGWSVDATTSFVVDAVMGSIVDRGVPAVVDPPADWSAVLRATDVVAVDAPAPSTSDGD